MNAVRESLVVELTQLALTLMAPTNAHAQEDTRETQLWVGACKFLACVQMEQYVIETQFASTLEATDIGELSINLMESLSV
jgi:hypothetical protein